ncbi:hypothetical protein [Frigidibacter sp. MR17.24]|uniref:hypothetical protein n=1 Tax=Frigidibacter sp. MR17.24 TaxID=3127345 RepID=UPI003012FE1A
MMQIAERLAPRPSGGPRPDRRGRGGKRGRGARLGLGLSLGLGLLVPAGPAAAGPWPRDRGATFLSFGQESGRSGDWTSLYGEYGLTGTLTLGVDGGVTDAGDGIAIVFLQSAFGAPDARHRFTASLGIGASRSDDRVTPVMQGAGSWGFGFDAAPGPAWFALDTKLRLIPGEGDPVVISQSASYQEVLTPVTLAAVLKTDATLGVATAGGNRLWIAQLQLEDSSATPLSARLATSVVQKIAGPLRGELGLITPLDGDSETAVKLGLWVEF